MHALLAIVSVFVVTVHSIHVLLQVGLIHGYD